MLGCPSRVALRKGFLLHLVIGTEQHGGESGGESGGVSGIRTIGSNHEFYSTETRCCDLAKTTVRPETCDGNMTTAGSNRKTQERSADTTTLNNMTRHPHCRSQEVTYQQH